MIILLLLTTTIICSLLIMEMDINAIVKKPNVTNIIVNALEKIDIALIAIALDAIIKNLNFSPQISIKEKKKIKTRKIFLYLAHAQKAGVIKIIVNATKIK